jgi:hypothetical protein
MADIVIEQLKQLGAGIANIPGETMRLGAYLANPARVVRKFTGPTELDNSRYGEGLAPWNRIPQILEGAADAGNRVISNAIGVNPNPSPQDDTGEFVARAIGNSIPVITGVPRTVAGLAPTVLQRLGQSLPGRIVGKTAELLTPTTIIPDAIVPAGKRFATAGQIAPRMAANVGVQTAAGVALEHATEPYDPTQPYMDFDEKGQVTDAYFPGPETTPGAGRIAARGVVSAVGDHPYAAALGGLALGAGALLARRKINLNNEIRGINATSDAVGPKDPGPSNVPIIDNPINNALHATGEVLADQNLRSKVALEKAAADTNAKAQATAQAAGQPAAPSVSAQPAKDAIELASEAAHASRLESAVNDGIVVTPRGEFKIPSLREIARELYGTSTKVKDFGKRFNEYISYADEINNRAYNAKQVAAGKQKLVNIDRLTGEEAGPTTIPANIVREPARVNMWHLDTPELQARKAAIEASPEAPQIKALADKYWAFHNRIADASVAFGVVSKAERAKWERVNPEFRHTTNLEQPKSPRTYRGRGHAAGAKLEGDVMTAAGEYADYMIAKMHSNRAQSMLYDMLKDSRWIGKIADPVELRRQIIIDATTGLPRPMEKKDVILNAANRRSFYRDGELVEFELLNPQLRFTYDKQPSHAQTMFGWIRGVAQSGMTGKLSLAVGQPFGLANAIMGTMFGTIARPAGRVIGKLDTGNKGVVAGVVRTLDPTTYTGNVWAAGADVKAIVHRAIADSVYNSIQVQGGLSRGIDAANRVLPGWIAPATARQLADRAAQSYLSSPLAERASRGGGNASTMGERDFDTPNGKVTLIDSVDPRYNAIRVLNDPKDLMSMWQEFRRTVTPANFKIGVRLLSDMQEAVGNMAQSSLYRQNRGKGQTLDAQARIPEQQRDAALGLARPYLDAAKMHSDNAKAYRAAGNRTAANAQLAMAKQQRALADPYLVSARAHDAVAAKAREEWFREVESLSLAARQLLGDTGQAGSGLANYRNPGATLVQKAVGSTLNSVPYGNIGMQAGARLIKAMKDDPSGTTASIATVVGSLAAVSLGSAELYDKIMGTSGTEDSAVKFDMGRPNWHQSRYVMGYIPGIPLDRQPAMRIEPTLQLPMSVARTMGMYALGWLGGTNDPVLGHTRGQILRVVNDRTWDLLKTAAVNTIPINQFPPLVGAGFAATGVEPPTPETVINRGGVNMIPQRGLGGFEDSRNAGDILGKRAVAVVGQIWGTAGATLVEAVNQGGQGERHQPGSFASRAIDTLQGKAVDRVPELSLFRQQANRLATNDFFADAVNRKEQKIENIRQNSTAVSREGALGVGRSQTLDVEGGGMQGAPDDLKPTLARVAAFGQGMQNLRQTRESKRQEILSIDQQNIDFAARRNKQNALAKEVQRLNREMLAHYTDFEDEESKRIGRRFRLDNLDPTIGLEQFPQQ